MNSIFLILILLNLILSNFALIWPCDKDSQCKFLSEKSTCSGGSCKCPPNQVYFPDSGKCIDTILYGDKCKESIECSLMPTGAFCSAGVCQCQNGYIYIHGRCRKQNDLGKSCAEVEDCWFGYDPQSVQCINNKCKCANGYYERHSKICRRKSSANEPCVVHQDCDTGKCEDFICKTTNAKKEYEESYHIPVNSSIFLTKFDETNANQFTGGSSHIETKLIESEISNGDKPTEKIEKKFGDHCENALESCDGLAHSICIENVCYCKPGYYPKKEICMAELGSKATEKTCENVYDLDTKLCICKRNTFCETNLRTCKKAIKKSASCTSDSQCSPYAAYCKKESPKTCECPSYATYDEIKQMCITKTELGTPCEYNCTLAHSVCHPESKLCTCEDKYKPTEDGKCVPGIGADCQRNKDCNGVKNSECSVISKDSKTCVCKQNFVHVNGNCLKKAENIEAECSSTEQCKPLLAVCENNKCVCGDNKHFSFGRCEEKKLLGESCVNEAQCYMPIEKRSVECRNSYCRCKSFYQTDSSSGICIKPKSNSSGRPSALKIITFLLFGSAFLVTAAAIRQAYY